MVKQEMFYGLFNKPIKLPLFPVVFPVCCPPSIASAAPPASFGTWRVVNLSEHLEHSGPGFPKLPVAVIFYLLTEYKPVKTGNVLGLI